MLEPDAKAKLAATVRDLRARLLKDLHDQADGRYRLGVPIDQSGLSERDRVRRLRLEAWLDEQVDSDRLKDEAPEDARARHLLAAEKLAAATFLNRLVVAKLLEAQERILPHVVTGGWTSAGYRDFREFAPELVSDEPTEGFATLLELLFEELALDLPGLFGKVELVDLFPPSPAMLRRLVEALDQRELRSAWSDDTTLGLIYQYWNDPEREALDAKLHGGGKVEPHEIASKTQMFTERYMVEWLQHNSLGQIWLAMCRKHGWTPAVEKHGTLDALEARRVEWRQKREDGEVELDALMPIKNSLEDR